MTLAKPRAEPNLRCHVQALASRLGLHHDAASIAAIGAAMQKIEAQAKREAQADLALMGGRLWEAVNDLAEARDLLERWARPWVGCATSTPLSEASLAFLDTEPKR